MSNSKLTNNQKEKIEQILLDSIRGLIKELNIQVEVSNEPEFVTESDIEFSAPEIGSQTSGYHFKCYDGYAIGDNGILEIKLSYPFLYQINADESKLNECLVNRYGNDHYKYGYEVHFGDIMLRYGKLDSFKIL